MVKFVSPVLRKEFTAATGNKKTHKETPHPVKPERKKRKSNISVIKYVQRLRVGLCAELGYREARAILKNVLEPPVI